MSIEFNWDELTKNAGEIEQQITDFLHAQFQAIQLPPFISSLAVSSFKLGSCPPEVTLKHFSDPFPEFVEADKELEEAEREEEPQNSRNRDISPSLNEGDATTIVHDEHQLNYALLDEEHGSPQPHSDVQGPFDMQSYIELKYAGDMQLAITATLLVNYPAPSFISLPLSIRVTNIDIHSLVVAAVVGKRIHLSILNDVQNKDDVVPSERVNVIRSMKIESEIGDNSDHGAVLRNVGKVEKFVLEQLRNVIREELVWPGWLTLEL